MRPLASILTILGMAPGLIRGGDTLSFSRFGARLMARKGEDRYPRAGSVPGGLRRKLARGEAR